MKGLFPTAVASNKSETDETNSSWLINCSFTLSPDTKPKLPKSILCYPLLRSVNGFSERHHNTNFEFNSSKYLFKEHIENSLYLLDTRKDLKLLEMETIRYCLIPKYESKFESHNSKLGLIDNRSHPLKFEHTRYFNTSFSHDFRTLKFDTRKFDFRSSFIQLESPDPPLLSRQHCSSQNPLYGTLPFIEQFKPNVASIQSWLEQFVPLAQFRIYNYPDLFSPDSLESILMALESAFSFHPCYIPLISTFMSYYSLVYPYKSIVDKWRKFLFILPQYSRLWNEYIDFISQSFDHFCVEDTISVYKLAFKRLISILERNLLSSPPEYEAERNLIYLIIKYCYFLKNAGYRERAISSIISLIQFNYMKRLNDIPKESLINQFIENWNGDGMSMLHNVQVNNYLSEIPDSFNDIHYFLENPSLFTKSWAEIECMKMDSWLFPYHDKQITNFAIDREKYIHHSQITPLFFTIQDSFHNFQLVLHLYILIGIPISFTSQVGNTHISDSEMVVKIDAKEWISLSPFKFTGSLIINSTDTKNVSYRRSILNKDQMSSLLNFLNLVIPTMDLDCQTIIFLIWFEYLINCLEFKITNVDFYRKIRTQIKVILAIDRHRNNLEIWAAYLIIQAYVSSLTEIFKIPILLFTQYNNTDYSLEILVCVCILLHLCTIVEARFFIDTSKLELYFIDCLTSKVCPDYNNIMNFCQNTSNKLPFSFSQYLICKQILWDHLKHSLEKCSSILNFPLLYSFIILHAEINLITSIKYNEECLVIRLMIVYVTNSSYLYEERNRFMEYVLYTSIYLIKRRIRLNFFPKSLVIALRQLGGHVIHCNPGLYAFLFQSYKITDNTEFSSDSMANSCYLGKISLQFSKINRENNYSLKINYMNLLGEFIDHAVLTHPNSLILWVAYLDYLLIMENVYDMRLGFLQAVKKLPGVKHLYMQYLLTKYADSMLAISTMEEKGIRIHFPMEEHILIQKNCNSV